MNISTLSMKDRTDKTKASLTNCALSIVHYPLSIVTAFFLCCLLFTIGFPRVAMADEITIGEGTTGTTYCFPINNFYNYSCTEQIYLSSEIGTAGTINSISFYYQYGTSYTASSVTMYMKNVSRSSFSSSSDYESLSAGDIVWTGSIAPTAAGWYTFTLTTPFQYDGTSNLLVAFYDGTSGYPGSSYTWRQTTAPNSASMALCYYSDSSTPDPYNLGSYSGNKTTYTYRLNTKIDITAGGAPQDVEIGDGTTTDYYYYPVNMFYNYSVTQQIYTADEIGMAGTINSVSFYYDYTAAFSMASVKMYMKNVDRSTFSSGSDVETISSSDLVWEGTFSGPAAQGWITINLTNPFAYNGRDNLLICMYDPTSGFPGNSYKFTTTSTGSNYRALTWYSDTYNPSIYDLTSYSGTKTYNTYRNNIQLNITPPACDQPNLSYSPASHTITYGGSYTRPTFNNPHSVTPLTATSSNTSVATVDLSGVVTLGSAAGTTTITVNFAGDDTYCEGSATYTLTVNKANLTSPTLTVTPKVMRNTLSWSPAGTGTASYQILRGPTSGSLTAYTTVTSSTTTYNDDGVTAGTPYYYQVRAIPDANHNDGAISTVVSGTPIGCSAELAVSPAACKDESITLTANVRTGAGTTITWKDGSTPLGTTTAGNDDGTVVSSTKNASFSTDGAHNLQITLSGGRCTNTASSASVKVVNAPSVTSPRDEISMCGSGSVELSLPASEVSNRDCGGLLYKWSTGSTASQITPTVSSSTTYTLTVSKVLYQKNDYIKIGNKEGIVVTPPTATAVGRAVALTDAIATLCEGSNISTDAEVRLAMIVNGGTEAASRKGFDIPAGASGGVCASNEISFPVVISNAPTIASISAPSAVCDGSPLTLSTPSVTANGATVSAQGWQISSSENGTYSAFTSGSTVSYSQNGYYIRYTATNACGTVYSNKVQITVTKAPTIASISAPSAVCDGSPLTLSTPSVTANGATVSAQGWQISSSENGTYSAFTSGSTVSYSQNGYYIRYYATNTCNTTYSQTVRITVNSLPTASIEGPATVCALKSETIEASGAGDGGSYNWSNDLGSGAIKTVAITRNTEYTVTVTDANGCKDEETISMSVTIPGNRPMTHVEHGAIWTGYVSTDWDNLQNWVYFDGNYHVPERLADTLNVILRTGGTEQCIMHDPEINSPSFNSFAGLTIRRPITIANATGLNVEGDLNIESGSLTFGGTSSLSISENATIASGASITFGNKDTLNVAGNFTLNGSFSFPASDTTPALRIGGNLTINSGASLGSAGTLVFAGSGTQRITNNNTGDFIIANNVRMNMHRSRAGVPHTVFPDGTIFSKTTIFEYGIMDGNVTFDGTGRTIVCGGYESYASGTVTKIGAGVNFTFPTGDDNVLGSITARITSGQNAVAKFHHKATGFTVEEGYPRWWNVADMCGADPFNHVSNFEYWDFNSSAALSGVIFSTVAATAGEHFHSQSEYPDSDNPDNLIQIAVYDECWRNGGGNLSITADFTEITISGVGVAARGTRGGSITSLGSKDPSVVLPIELTSFTATCDGRSSLVEWTTATEKNNDYFVLERSDDAVNFTEIARVAGAGNSIEPIDYSYTDYGIHGGDNYYRLVQVDYDGTRTVSEIVVANCIEPEVGEPDVQAYPNPFNGELTLVLDNFSNRAATIEIYDMLGKLIYTDKVAAPQNSYETVLNLSNLPPAAYNIRVSTNDFVINRNVIKN